MKTSSVFYIFGQFASLILGPKTIKNVSNILPKLASKTMLQIGSIWEPTWLHFGRVLGTKLVPSWYQIAPKIDPKTYKKNDPIFDPLWTDFWWILAPTWHPNGRTQRCCFGQLLALGALLAPRPAQDASQRHLGTDFARF